MKVDQIQDAEALPMHSCPKTKSSNITIGPNESFHEFLERVRPSMTIAELQHIAPTTLSPMFRWIVLHNPFSSSSNTLSSTQKTRCLEELHTIVSKWCNEMPQYDPSQRLKQAQNVSAMIYALAKEYNYGSGKLLLSISTHQVNSIWQALAFATIQGKLGSAIKISTQSQQNHSLHIISIAIPFNFWDQSSLTTLLTTLHRWNVQILAFKPDIFALVHRTYNLRHLHLSPFVYYPAST